jgi:CheY-like chemotaxis protein
MTILLVNDNRDEIGVFGEALRRIDKSIIFDFVTDGVDALRYLRENSQQPDFIFVNENEFFLLERIRNSEEFGDIPVTVYTTSTNPDDIDKAIAYGASFLPKPNSYRTLVTLLRKKLEKLVVED